jgi:enterochelin esterase-like enzyme
MRLFAIALTIFLFSNCSTKPAKQEDDIFSRRLQRKVHLTILNTKLPKDPAQWNLLLLNDGNEFEKLDVEKIIDSLYNAKKIGPLVVVAIHAGDRMQEYGISNKPDFMGRGAKADDYSEFVGLELLPFIRKKTGANKFRTVAIAGASLGGLSAFDVAWNNATKIDKAGIFSGSFWWRDKDAADKDYDDEKNRIILSKIRASRKTSDQQYFFYYGLKEETSDRDGDGIIDVADDTKDLIHDLQKFRKIPSSSITVVENKEGRHDWPWWRESFPAFLDWAF